MLIKSWQSVFIDKQEVDANVAKCSSIMSQVTSTLFNIDVKYSTCTGSGHMAH